MQIMTFLTKSKQNNYINKSTYNASMINIDIIILIIVVLFSVIIAIIHNMDEKRRKKIREEWALKNGYEFSNGLISGIWKNMSFAISSVRSEPIKRKKFQAAGKYQSRRDIGSDFIISFESNKALPNFILRPAINSTFVNVFKGIDMLGDSQLKNVDIQDTQFITKYVIYTREQNKGEIKALFNEKTINFFINTRLISIVEVDNNKIMIRTRTGPLTGENFYDTIFDEAKKIVRELTR